MNLAGYNVKKAAQVVAFFVIKAGSKINVLKLTKLIYLADRKFLEKYDTPILFDRLVSMPHGPVNSVTYDYIGGYGGYKESDDWNNLIADREGYDVGLKQPNISTDDLDQLSEAELEVLDSIWTEFGKMGKYEIRDYTHKYCLEWEDPNGSAKPISYEMVFKFLGKENSDVLSQAIEEERQLKRVWE